MLLNIDADKLKVPRLGWGFSHPGLVQMLRL